MFSRILLFSLSLLIPLATQDKKIEYPTCEFNGIKLYGKVKFVSSFPDIKIQFVNSFPDIKVKFVENFQKNQKISK